MVLDAACFIRSIKAPKGGELPQARQWGKCESPFVPTTISRDAQSAECHRIMVAFGGVALQTGDVGVLVGRYLASDDGENSDKKGQEPSAGKLKRGPKLLSLRSACRRLCHWLAALLGPQCLPQIHDCQNVPTDSPEHQREDNTSNPKFPQHGQTTDL